MGQQHIFVESGVEGDRTRTEGVVGGEEREHLRTRTPRQTTTPESPPGRGATSNGEPGGRAMGGGRKILGAVGGRGGREATVDAKPG